VEAHAGIALVEQDLAALNVQLGRPRGDSLEFDRFDFVE
jgi:hypothetical protein